MIDEPQRPVIDGVCRNVECPAQAAKNGFARGGHQNPRALDGPRSFWGVSVKPPSVRNVVITSMVSSRTRPQRKLSIFDHISLVFHFTKQPSPPEDFAKNLAVESENVAGSCPAGGARVPIAPSDILSTLVGAGCIISVQSSYVLAGPLACLDESPSYGVHVHGHALILRRHRRLVPVGYTFISARRSKQHREKASHNS